jgi:hypothetical protein
VADDSSHKDNVLDEEISAILQQISRENPLDLTQAPVDHLNTPGKPFKLLFDLINQPALLFMLSERQEAGLCLEANPATFHAPGVSAARSLPG